jgi:putative ABC transport system permease protein
LHADQLMTLSTHFRYALRSLRSRPGFTAVAITTLALGIGATTAIFTVANAVLLRSLPYPDARGLVSFWEEDVAEPSGQMGGLVSHLDFLDVEAEAASFEAMAQYSTTNLTVTGLGEAEVVPGGVVTPELFRVFSAEPVLGRTFTADESRHQGADAVVISESFWRTRFGGDPNVLDRTLMVQGRPRPIVGVAPAGFDYPAGARLWLPVQNDPEGCGRGCLTYAAVGRLRPDATLSQARTELIAIANGLRAEYPDENARLTFEAASLQDLVVRDIRAAMWVLFGAVAMVLLIACANVANLILVRGSARRIELAVRSALGASRRTIIAQLMAENVVLALAGGLGGLLLAGWGVAVMTRLAPSNLPRMEEVALDGTTLVFALGVVALSVLIFGLAPALRLANEGLAEAIRHGGSGALGERRGHRFRASVLSGQVALSVLLLLGAGLMLRSLTRMQAVELGLEPDNVALFRLSLPTSRYAGPAERIRFMEQLEEELQGIPGVERVATTVAVPFGPVNLFGGFRRAELPEPGPGETPVADYRVLGPTAVEVLGLRLARGRSFQESDRQGAEPVALINQTAARRFWPGEDPVGKQIGVQISVGYSESEPRTIVGVVEDFRTQVTQEPEPTMLVPYAQAGASFPHVAIQYRGVTHEAVLAGARKVLAELDSELPMAQPGTLQGLIDQQLAAPRFYLLLLALFALMAVVLAAVGIYGLVAYLVVQRTRELGLRMALGARVAAIIRLVVWQGAGPALVGMGGGLLGALALGRVIGGILYQVEPNDLPTLLATAAVLVAVVVAATTLPALRAARIPPAEALRSDG